MKRQLIAAAILLTVFCGQVAGQRTLDRVETLDILRALTDQPRDTWISSGVIRARHVGFRSATEQILESDVTVHYDGNRFRWQIDLDPDLTEAARKQEGPSARVDTRWNSNRVFAWDGSQYTIYSKAANHAIVYEDTSRIPVVVNGPLTAGLIPWGYGKFTYDLLAAAELTATETQTGGQSLIDLTIKPNERLRMDFVLDRDKGYAVLSSTICDKGRSVVVRTCDGYRNAGGRWVPEIVAVETFDDSQTPAQLLSYDHWHLASIGTQISEGRPFEAGIAPDALVEVYTQFSEKPLAYYNRPQADTGTLRQRRLEIIAAGQAQANCATVATQYILSLAGKEITRQQKESLAAGGGGTSLYAIKRVLGDCGLQCRAVRTDIEGLRKAGDCWVILHLPGSRHFVVLDHIDESRVWLIDLDHNRFYFPVESAQFGLDWKDGTALLVSRSLPTGTEGFKDLSDTQLKNMVGADSFGTYSCTQRVQAYNIIYCSEGFGGVPCFGTYRIYSERFACELNASGGSCSGEGLLGCTYTYCIEDPFYPGECAISGSWYNIYMHACR